VFGGRVRRGRDLYEWMVPLAGLVFAVDLFSPIDVPPLLQYLAFGIVFGAMGGKTVVVRRERRSGEMPADRVRYIEHVGVAIGIALMALAVVAQVAVAHL
jgi:hypothetical protein